MSELALPVSAIVKGKDGEAHRVQAPNGVDRVSQVPFGPMQVDRGVGIGALGRTPPAAETGNSRFGRGECDLVKGDAGSGRRPGNRCSGPIEQLPAPLPEGETERCPDADCGQQENGGDCRREPAGADGNRRARGTRLLPASFWRARRRDLTHLWLAPRGPFFYANCVIAPARSRQNHWE